MLCNVPSSVMSPDTLFNDEDDELSEAKQGSSPLKALKCSGDRHVKLELPLGSKSEPWTSIRRLRPIYDVPDEATGDLSAKDLYQLVRERKPVQAHVSASWMQVAANGLQVAKLGRDEFVTCSYISAEGLESDSEFDSLAQYERTT